MSKFPRPYQNNVKVDESQIVYVPFDKMDIGARSSGLPKAASTGPKSIEHVGSGTGSPLTLPNKK